MNTEEAATDLQQIRQRWRQEAASTPGTLLFECTAADTEATTQDAAERRTLLFRSPLAILVADTAEQLPGLLRSLEVALAEGHYVAGYLTYEAACVLEHARGRELPGEPLAWFGIYAPPEHLNTAAQRTDDPPTASRATSATTFPLCFALQLDRSTYLRRVSEAKRWIAAGDTYQINFTTAVESSFRGDPDALYTALAAQQPTAFSALLHTAADRHILSFSPELLFCVEADGRIAARPMKGTATTAQDDDAITAAASLRNDSKSRAEHVMIVDLLRNDLNRVCTAGSVHVDPMLHVEQYGTLLQMTSTVAGRLRPGVALGDLFRALLPPGSMTGAPKHRTTQLIRTLEDQPRGVYSGAMGFAAPDGSAVFSVPIRTLVLADQKLRMGVGGGIVADSHPEDEFAECWLKCGFLHRASHPFELVETLCWDGAYAWIEDHLDRLESSANRLGFRFDRTAIRAALDNCAATLPGPSRVRLLLDRAGQLRFEPTALDRWPDPLRVRVSEKTVWSGDSFLRHKTTYRPIYDRELARARRDSFADTLFRNEHGDLTEGAISSLFALLDGAWVTPPLQAGVLPGVARGRLLHRGLVSERNLTEHDLEHAVALMMANGVRGTAQVHEIELRSGERLQFPTLATIPHL